MERFLTILGCTMAGLLIIAAIWEAIGSILGVLQILVRALIQ